MSLGGPYVNKLSISIFLLSVLASRAIAFRGQWELWTCMTKHSTHTRSGAQQRVLTGPGDSEVRKFQKQRISVFSGPLDSSGRAQEFNPDRDQFHPGSFIIPRLLETRSKEGQMGLDENKGKNMKFLQECAHHVLTETPNFFQVLRKAAAAEADTIISIIIILAAAIALIIGFGISGRYFITVTTLTSAGNIGEDGILSCTFEPDIKLSDIVIQWLKEGVMGLVHEFKEGKDDLSDQDEMFRGRTAVFADQVIVGNASLRLKNVQLADAGTYKCYIITSKGKGNANLEYKTGAFSIPEVNVNYNASSESLRCEAPRWFPQPTVVWASQVDQGANFSEVSNTSFELNSENVTMKVVSVLYNVTINNTYSCMIENNIAKATGDIKVTDSEIKRRSHLQLLNSKASLCVSSFFAITWIFLPLSLYLMPK
ncbi:V-set domain-containing T-cell activation inhibitor 1 [Diceros bicornis minor]|uniref:V-set domain-containing T-cell activation inhibitor 1 n=1 Tax=Diceros bicornis minor TaxID=77932 RepID=UPI0026F28C6F|nr:V-set domain-containing T-cell activation inhibitor 1 [Diceros bicornis minor]